MLTACGFGERKESAIPPVKKRKTKYDLLYRSGLEEKVCEWLTRREIPFEYEPCKVKYTVPESYHEYTPDLSLKQPNTFIEIKGYMDSATRQKMVWIKKSNPTINFRILFQNADTKIRKGSKTTYGDWATKNGFEWADFRSGIPKEWLKV